MESSSPSQAVAVGAEIGHGNGHGHGHGSVTARFEGGRTVLSRVHATSPLRFVRPTFPGTRSATLCLLTFGGGLVDGDVIDVDLRVEAGATLVVFTQATTKAFRGSSRQTITAEVHGTLVFLPDPVACFAGSRFRQRVDITLHGDGSAITLDGFTSGRAAFGDRWAFDGLDLATTVRTADSRVLVRDALRLDRDDGSIAARLDRFEAFATVLAVGPRVGPVVTSILAESIVSDAVVAAASPLPPSPLPPSPLPTPQVSGAIARIAATSPSHALDEA
ncbi:MAG: Urease accessory protein UreD, partial [Myxococcaceae bacterium]|nr:Urease accessory protein UreD [Myxococcaceae bacterium]